MENNVMQGPTPPRDGLVTYVAKILREDIHEGSAERGKRIELRQPPIYGDDYDSWSMDSANRDKWLYVAESVIRAIDRYRSQS